MHIHVHVQCWPTWHFWNHSIHTVAERLATGPSNSLEIDFFHDKLGLENPGSEDSTPQDVLVVGEVVWLFDLG